MEERYYVLLQGRKVGPYDRRTVVGMRIKDTLTSAHVLIGTDGSQSTVADLIRKRGPAPPFNPDRSGGTSAVQATFTAALVGVQGPGADIPRFKNEVEARIQSGVLRIAGRFREGLGWKQGRVKLALHDVVHVRVKGSQVDLWLRASQDGASMQRVCLELFAPESARELVGWLPGATPWPEGAATTRAEHKMLWLSGLGVAVLVVVLVVLILVALLQRRMY